jgi:hypothetical protein
MAHFAKLDENNIVTDVVVVNNNTATDEAAGIAFLKDLYKEPNAVWKQTSYNTKQGKYWDHSDPNQSVEHADQTKAYRLNFAGIGFEWREDLQGFIFPKPEYPSWILDTSTGTWDAPIPFIETEIPYTNWNEELQNWVDSEGNTKPEE